MEKLPDITETVELLFDKNNNTAYKALQKLQKESEETNCVYPYLDRFIDMLDSEILIFVQEGFPYLPIMQNGIQILKLMKSLTNI